MQTIDNTKETLTPYQEYVKYTYDIVFTNSIYAKELDREGIERVGMEIANSAISYEECEPAIQHIIDALRQKGDTHTHLVTEKKKKEREKEEIEPKCQIIDNCGYILVPGITGFDQEKLSTYIHKLQGFLKEMDEKDIEGWIIDLRMNDGGNMEPMIVGMGPLFDSEILGSFIFNNGRKDTWGYREGKYIYNDMEDKWIDNPTVLSKKRKIAILIGGNTASSGEMLLISFLGNDNVKTFGNNTSNYLTGVNVFELPDKKLLALATSQTADRKGRVYSTSIIPDEVCSNKDIIESASGWVRRE